MPERHPVRHLMSYVSHGSVQRGESLCPLLFCSQNTHEHFCVSQIIGDLSVDDCDEPDSGILQLPHDLTELPMQCLADFVDSMPCTHDDRPWPI